MAEDIFDLLTVLGEFPYLGSLISQGWITQLQSDIV